MDDNFARCLAFTLAYEGGRADNPKDPGGRTNQGVTQRTYAAFRAKAGLGSADVYGMTTTERDAIYRSGFWNAVGAGRIPAGADLAVFDLGVNSGPARALKAYAKRTSNDGAAIVRAVCADRLSFLHALGTFRTFGRGWTARVAACEALGVKMAEHARIGVPVDAPTAPQVASTLRAAGRAAAATAKRRGASAGLLATTGAVAQPTAAGAAHVPGTAVAVAAVVILLGVALLLLRTHQAHARAAAYATAAA